MTTDFGMFVRGYVEAVLWLTTDESGESYLEDFINPERGLSPDALAKVEHDCARFLVSTETFNPEQYEQAGHDFFLTRQGHGTGFWDRPEIYGEERAKALAALAKEFREIHPWLNEETEKVEID